MINESNRMYNAMGDYVCALTSKDVPIGVRRELVRSENRTHIESVMLCASLGKFKLNKSINVNYDHTVQSSMLNLLDELVSILYSILYYINPELITAVTDGSELIPIMSIEDVIEIGDYSDSIISNGIQNLDNYNNSILYLLKENVSDLLKYINKARQDSTMTMPRDSDGNIIIDGENQIQHNYLKYLGVYSFIYKSMFKLISKYMDGYNELHSFSNMFSYYIGVSSYVMLKSIPRYDENYIEFSKTSNRHQHNLRTKYSDSLLYTFDGVRSPSESSYNVHSPLFLFEIINGILTENMCSENIIFDEFAFLSIYGMAVYNNISPKNALNDIQEYKLRVFANIRKRPNNLIEVEFYLRTYSRSFHSYDSQRIYRLYIINCGDLEPSMLDVILREVGYNFNKYVFSLNRTALTLESEYTHSILEDIIDDDSGSRDNIFIKYPGRIDSDHGRISMNNIPNISDLNVRSTYVKNIIDNYTDRFINN